MHRRITRRTFLPLVLLAAVDLQSPTVSERTDSRSGQPAPSPAPAMLVATTSQATRDLLPRATALATLDVSSSPRVTERIDVVQPSPTPSPPDADPIMAAKIKDAHSLWQNGDPAAALLLYRQVVATGRAPSTALLNLGEVEVALGQVAAARQTWQRVLDAKPGEPLQARARFLIATADLATDNWAAVLRDIDVATAPDGLGDLVVLERAKAAVRGGNPDGARGELRRPELRHSTNRVILESAGRLADQLGDAATAADLYARAASYPGWAADRIRVMQEAAHAFLKAGAVDSAVSEDRHIIETYGWTAAAQQAGNQLERLGGMTAYHRGLLALNRRAYDAARAAFTQAAAGGLYAAEASKKLRELEEVVAWRAASNTGTADAFRSFYTRYPDSGYSGEARFQEGLAYYESGELTTALTAWDRSLTTAQGDARARLLLWTGKTMSRLGRSADARARWRETAETHPLGYYALRARDLLAGASRWPSTSAVPASDPTAGRDEAERWLASWAGPPSEGSITSDNRVRRGLGLLALGYQREATAEFNALTAETTDAWFLFRLASLLAENDLWFPESMAAARLIALSPAKSVADAPVAVQRLVYPRAYWDLVQPEAKKRGVDPALLLALIYQESRDDPYALSVADARGLTQILPSTGRGIATALGRRQFDAADLDKPTVAVEFGAWYLANQLRAFGGDPFRALAAYNAGATPVARWNASDPDLFVERIDYPETRNYVREVYLHHAIYAPRRP